MTIAFAFAGRCSTEDQQDPVASRNWQLTRAQTLISPHGSIVAEYFDIGDSRSIPWRRRPQAAALLDALKSPDRGFDAVVIGEPQRAFYGNQFGLTFPVFTHYGVPLWVPEVGGPIDPESEAHDLVMSVFGGVSKGERTRIKIRVRTAMAAQARIEGRFLGGRPPYGYRLVDAGPHPNPAKAADGKRLHRLEPDPETALVVTRIFTEYLDGIGIFAIAQRLTADGIPCPSAHDPGRNRHRSGIAWSKSAVRTILTNPRYTGHEVWNKQRKEETLIDVEDVALGHHTKQTWNHKDAWVRSEEPTHPALITPDTFDHAQQRLASRGPASTGRQVRTQHPYAFKSLITHGTCGRRMQGNWVRDEAYYRCRFPAEYAIANTIDHPRSAYLREADLIDPLDTWLAGAFTPRRIEHSLTAIEEAQPQSHPQAEALRRALAECDHKLARHRAALEAGADPSLVASWSREVQAERLTAETRLKQLKGPTGPAQRMSRQEIRDLVDALGGLLNILRQADPADKAEVYRHLGLRLTYDHEKQEVLAESRPAPRVGVLFVSEGGLEPPRP
ncbi:recombinase family protein [Streptomyces sp. PT12]|uniref:recombinase family protein n=1 Tax=Streptomyces sp. PT12 TaxID=1510197 RepID=UPI000DE1B979|nr:recombinase family protein [Streptomyces sp. PT12]RBM08076.1 recombinase family protein [Streptomyces sp. PT12]